MIKEDTFVNLSPPPHKCAQALAPTQAYTRMRTQVCYVRKNKNALYLIIRMLET